MPCGRSASWGTRPGVRPGSGACRPPPSADLGIRAAEPRGRGGGPGPEVDPDAGGVQPLEDVVQGREVERVRARLQVRPPEDVHRDQIDPGLAHQADVLVPHLGRPLLGVVVAPEAMPSWVKGVRPVILLLVL